MSVSAVSSSIFESNQNSLEQNFTVVWVRIGLYLILVIAFALILISFLNYSNYRKNYLELNQARNLVLAKDIRQSVEKGLSMGIAPSENMQLLPHVKELMRQQDGVRYIAIVDSFGGIVGEGENLGQLSSGWKELLSSISIDTYWRTDSAEIFELGMPFVNNFNVKSGAVVIGYDRLAITVATHKMLSKLFFDMLMVLLVFSLFVFAGVYLLTRNFNDTLHKIASTIGGEIIPRDKSQNDTPELDEDVVNDVHEFKALSNRLLCDISELEREIIRTHGNYNDKQAGRS